MIDRQTIERIKDTADIVDVVSEFVSLKRVGANYRGLCPFHNDHTPSFYVSPSRRTCHCFVCGEGGDSVGFIMKHEQLTYPDALRWLANRYHIQIQERELSDKQKQENSERESMFVINEWAANYFHDILENDVDGRAIGMQYFRQRGVRDDIIEKFRLGFCLNDRQALSREALRKGYKQEFLLKTGLCYARDNGDLVDRFAGRAMFPWIGVSGKVVAFGGRVLDSRTKGVNQKYVNSPDSVIYHKDHELYGIFQAKKAIAKEDCVYMVEGYTDVISMHQCGIENVVANSGTALSEHQIRILHRFTQNIILLYDGDAAGIKAALRGTDMLLKDGMNVKVMLLPDGDDPDSFAKKHTAEEFRQYIEDNKTDFIQFKTHVLLNGVNDPVKRAEAISSIIQSISVIGDPIIRATYIQDCTSRLGINEQTLISKLNECIRVNRQQDRLAANRGEKSQTTATTSTPTATPSQQPSPQQQPSNGPSWLPPVDMPPMGVDDDMPPMPSEPAPPAVPEANANAVPQPTAAPEPVLDIPFWKTRPLNAVPDLIIRMVIKYGGELIYDNVEVDAGQYASFTLAQYVSYDLAQDSLAFTEGLYNQILAEAVKGCDGVEAPNVFDSEKYFTMHPDYDISAFSIKISQEETFLSKSLEMTMTPELLRDKIEHLLLDYRNEYVTAEIKRITAEIAAIRGDMDQRLISLMQELQKVQQMRALIAKRIGSSVLGRKMS